MSYFYDPLRRDHKSVRGAVACGSKVTFRITQEDTSGEASFSAPTCTLLLRADGEEYKSFPMQRTRDGFSLPITFSETGLYFYRFCIGGHPFGCGKGRRGEFERESEWQITVYDPAYKTPDWIKGTVMYQIFPDRFFRSGNISVKGREVREDWGGQPEFRPNELGKVLNHDFFGGNLRGVREKLGYLQHLHVGTIYFNPIFESSSNHRYDTADYKKIDPLLGDEEEFRALVEDAESRGMHILLDGVFNHTGDDSRYFNKYGRYKEELGAHQSPDSPYFSWYTFRDFPDSYECWWGIDTLPAVNEKDEGYQNFILGENGVLRHWMKFKIAGWRLDVADELPDFFLKKIRDTVKAENPDAVIIGEVWEDASNKIAYDERRTYLQGGELDSVMNYPLKDGILNFLLSGSCNLLRETMAELVDNYPKQTLDCLMNILGTHDTPRVLTVLGGKPLENKEEMAVTSLTTEERARGEMRLRMAALLQYTLPGVPCVYYGDEIGTEGYQDPFCRGCFDWNRTGGELEAYYAILGKLRTETFADIFRDGEYREIYANRGCFVFERRKEQAVYVFANNSSEKFTVYFDGTMKEFVTGDTAEGKFEIEGFSYGILARN